MARFHVTLTDDPQLQPDGVRVVSRQRFGWVALVGAFAALLCLPAFRHVVLDQAHVVTTGKAPEWLSGITGASGIAGNPTTDAYRARLSATLAKYPDDVDLHLGAVVLALPASADPQSFVMDQKSPTWKPRSDHDPRLVYLNDLRQRFPGNVRVLATALRYYSQNTIHIARAELTKSGFTTWPKKTKLLDPTAAAEVLALIEEGERADPQNAYFPTLAAATHVAAGDDSQAEEAIHRAAACQVWRDYSWAEGGGAERLLTLAYGDRGVMMRAMPLAAILLPHFSSIRASYRLLVDRAAPTSEGWQLRYDLVRVGAMMRDGGETLIARLVGAAIQEIAFETDRVKGQGPHAAEERDEVKRQRIRVLLTRAEREAPAIVPALSREADRLAAFRAKRDRIKSVGVIFDRIMQPAIQRELLGLHLMGNLLGVLALWAGCSAILFLGAKLPWLSAETLRKRLHRPAYLVIVAISVVLLLIPIGAAALNPADAVYALGPGLLWLLFVVRPLITTPRPTPAWQPAAAASIAIVAVISLLAAIWPWEFLTHTTRGWWSTHLAYLHFFDGEWPDHQGTNPLGFVLATGPAPLVTFVGVIALIASLRKRATLSGWLAGAGVAAKALSAVLAVGYLVFTLVHVPATLRDGRIASQNFRNETAILDQP